MLKNRLAGLNEAPRELPFMLKVLILFGSPGFLGGFFILLSTVMTVVFWFDDGENRYLGECKIDKGELRQADGRILRREKTSVTVGGGKHRKGKPVYAYYFTFQTADGFTVEQHSYTAKLLDENITDVKIEYLQTEPLYARIAGTGYAPLSSMGWFPALFALLGLGIAAAAPFYRKKNYDILTNGVLADGTCIAVNPTGRKIKNRSIYAYNYQYTDLDGSQCFFTVESTEDKALADEFAEAVFYLPSQNKQLLADKVAKGLTVNSHGGFEMSALRSWGARFTLYTMFCALCALIWLLGLWAEVLAG